MSKSPYNLRNAADHQPKSTSKAVSPAAAEAKATSNASSASIAAVKAIKANPSKLDECQHQLTSYNPASALGFDNLLRYIARTMLIEPPELRRFLDISAREIEEWSKPNGHPPSSVIRKKVAEYAIRRLKSG